MAKAVIKLQTKHADRMILPSEKNSHKCRYLGLCRSHLRNNQINENV